MTIAEVATTNDTNLAEVLSQVSDIEVVEGSGAWVRSRAGRSYLDFTAGIAVASTGHCHPTVVEAIRDQAGRFIHAQVNCYRHGLLAPLATRLTELTPDGITQFFFANSGAEAVEASIKLAKQATGRTSVVAFRGGFHGRTHLAMALTTSKVGVRGGFQPLPSGVLIAPYPYRVGGGYDPDEVAQWALQELDTLLSTQASPSEIAAFIIEPVLGEGGYVQAPKAFLTGLAERARQHGILLIADEIQSGFGRTGKMFAVNHFDVQPDILIMAKGMASGFPISAIGAREHLWANSPRGSHGGTYGGNPIGCAAALATIEVITGEGLVENAAARGNQLRSGLQAIASSAKSIVDVRGPGLMIGVEFTDSQSSAAVRTHCIQQGALLLMDCGQDGRTIRFMPPLIVSSEEVATALTVFEAAVVAAEAIR